MLQYRSTTKWGVCTLSLGQTGFFFFNCTNAVSLRCMYIYIWLNQKEKYLACVANENPWAVSLLMIIISSQSTLCNQYNRQFIWYRELHIVHWTQALSVMCKFWCSDNGATRMKVVNGHKIVYERKWTDWPAYNNLKCCLRRSVHVSLQWGHF